MLWTVDFCLSFVRTVLFAFLFFVSFFKKVPRVRKAARQRNRDMHRLQEFIRREVGGRYFPDSDVPALEEGPSFFVEDAWKPEPFAFFRVGCGKTHPPCRVEPFAFMPASRPCSSSAWKDE